MGILRMGLRTGRGSALPSALLPLILLPALLLAMACGSGGLTAPGGFPQPHARGGPAPNPTELESAGDLLRHYQAAIADAAVFVPKNQVSALATVDGPVTVVSWQECDCSACAPCLPGGRQTLEGELWVTLEPEVRRACQTFPKGQRVLRTQQLLGLPPMPAKSDSTYFMLLRVERPDGLFRPCTNPDPQASGPCTESFPIGVSATHVQWMADQMLTSWRWPLGYPWTRLGYTYNWNPEAPSVTGLSEFVLAGGSKVKVLAVVPTEDYCKSREPARAAKAKP